MPPERLADVGGDGLVDLAVGDRGPGFDGGVRAAGGDGCDGDDGGHAGHRPEGGEATSNRHIVILH